MIQVLDDKLFYASFFPSFFACDIRLHILIYDEKHKSSIKVGVTHF